MYNRYIPQSDGTYQRRRIQEQVTPSPPPRPAPPEKLSLPVCQPQEPPRRPMPPNRPRPRPCREPEGTGVMGFLKQLLPRDFDTTDLMVVLLLLLMSGDCQEDQNTALLTLALYLFL